MYNARTLIVTALVGFAALASPSAVHAQSIWDRLVVRQNLDSQNSVGKPGFIEYTQPDDGPDVIQVGLGLKFEAVQTTRLSFGPSLEYLQNTSSDKPVDSLKVGTHLEWQVRDVSLRGRPRHTPIVLSRLAYARDGVKDTLGLDVSLASSYMFAGQGPAFRPNAAFGPAGLSIIYSPLIGLEVWAPGRPANAGTVVRVAGQLDITLQPAAEALDGRLEFLLSGSLRRDVSGRSAAGGGRDHRLFTGSGTFYFLKEDNRAVGIAITRVSGEDPSKGFQLHRFWRLGLMVRVGG